MVKPLNLPTIHQLGTGKIITNLTQSNQAKTKSGKKINGNNKSTLISRLEEISSHQSGGNGHRIEVQLHSSNEAQKRYDIKELLDLVREYNESCLKRLLLLKDYSW